MGTDPGSAVVLITGVMASGKSTVAELLAGQLPRAAHVRGDVFRRMVVSGREELLPEETPEARAQLGLRYGLSVLVADEYAHHGWTAVVQDIILGDDLTRYVARVQAARCTSSCWPPGHRAARVRLFYVDGSTFMRTDAPLDRSPAVLHRVSPKCRRPVDAGTHTLSP